MANSFMISEMRNMKNDIVSDVGDVKVKFTRDAAVIVYLGCKVFSDCLPKSNINKHMELCSPIIFATLNIVLVVGKWFKGLFN